MGDGQNIAKPWVHQRFTFYMKANVVCKRDYLCSNLRKFIHRHHSCRTVTGGTETAAEIAAVDDFYINFLKTFLFHDKTSFYKVIIQ